MTTSEYLGAIDVVTNRFCKGWAYHDAADSSVIDIYYKEELIGSAVADEFRTDLLALGINSGNAGFFFSFPQNIADKTLLRFSLRQIDQDLRLPTEIINPGELQAWKTRKALKLIGPHTPPGARILEVGALHNPLDLPIGYQALYMDHCSTKELKNKYANDPHVDVREFVDVDLVFAGGKLTRKIKRVPKFDVIVASHVIEHLPNPIQWLRSMRELLAPSGILALAVPDKSFTFDYLRVNTRTSEWIDGFINNYEKPTPAMIFDAKSQAVTWNGEISWYTWSSQPTAAELTPASDAVSAYVEAKRAMNSSEYVDIHCWAFTPQSFVDLINELISLNLCDFVIESQFESDGNEFIVRLLAT